MLKLKRNPVEIRNHLNDYIRDAAPNLLRELQNGEYTFKKETYYF